MHLVHFSPSSEGGDQFFDLPVSTGCVAGLTLPPVDAFLHFVLCGSSTPFFFLLHELGLVVAQGLESSFEG